VIQSIFHPAGSFVFAVNEKPAGGGFHPGAIFGTAQKGAQVPDKDLLKGPPVAALQGEFTGFEDIG
jgi:hypothetical protein